MNDFSKYFDNLFDKADKFFDDNRSNKNDLSGNSNMHSNSKVNKAVQYLIEKGIEKAENVVYKIIKPYEVLEILDPTYANIIITDILNQLPKFDEKDQLYLDLFIININMNNFLDAKKYYNNILDTNIKNKYKIIIKLISLDDNDFYDYFNSNYSSLLELSIYNILRRFSNIAFAKNKFNEVLTVIEKCCKLNPLSKSDQNDLLHCYSKLNLMEHYKIQKEILTVIGV